MTTESEKVILLKKFRAEHPDWVIDSKVVKTDGAIVIQAVVIDLDGKVRSSGHGSVAFQSATFNTDLAEQAEDSAIERALIHFFGGDAAPTDPSPAPPTGDDTPGSIAAKAEKTSSSSTPSDTQMSIVGRQPAQPFLAADTASKRRIRKAMQTTPPAKFANGTPGVPPARTHRRTGT